MHTTLVDKDLNALVHAAVQAVADATSFEYHELDGEHLDIAQCPERSIWVRHRSSHLAIHLCFRRASSETTVHLEYGVGEHGNINTEQFISADYSTIRDAAVAFEFAIHVLLDVRKQIDHII